MVTLINQFAVTGDVDEFQQVLDEFRDFMAGQPGALSYRLVRSLRRPEVFVEFADWTDVDSHRTAVNSDGFRALIKRLAPLVEKPTPDLYVTVREHVNGSESVGAP